MMWMGTEVKPSALRPLKSSRASGRWSKKGPAPQAGREFAFTGATACVGATVAAGGVPPAGPVGPGSAVEPAQAMAEVTIARSSNARMIEM
jgi:hypothetical protein